MNEAKWRNVICGRSLELDAPFLCTMARRNGQKGKAVALAYDGLRPVQPKLDTTRAEGGGGFVLVNLAVSTLGKPDEDRQAFTDKTSRVEVR